MAIPLHRCTDLDRALAFYVDVLGAQVTWRVPTGRAAGPGFAAVRWRDHELYLSSHAGDGAPGAISYVPVADVDAVFAELVARGHTPRTDRGPVFAGPLDQSWGAREVYVMDPDGNCLRFAAPAPPARP